MSLRSKIGGPGMVPYIYLIGVVIIIIIGLSMVIAAGVESQKIKDPAAKDAYLRRILGPGLPLLIIGLIGIFPAVKIMKDIK